MTLIFATNNQNKLKEIQKILGKKIELLSLKDINCDDEIPEDHDTLEANASQKAFHIFNKYNVNCFADDTGLEIETLNNEPGVYSARYAGENKNSEDNIEKALHKLKGAKNRKARFRTVISLILEGEEYQFEGIVNGTILEKKRGNDGFGYDPIFQPEGYNTSFAEMDMTEKNIISHRGKAVKKLVEFLLKL